jgi:hypothetical protein
MLYCRIILDRMPDVEKKTNEKVEKRAEEVKEQSPQSAGRLPLS